MKARALEDVRGTLLVGEPTDTSNYEDAIQKALEQIEVMKRQYGPVAAEKQRISAEIEPLKHELDVIMGTIHSHAEEGAKIRGDIERLNLDRQDYLPRIQYWVDKLAKQRHEIETLEARLTEEAKYLEVSRRILFCSSQARHLLFFFVCLKLTALAVGVYLLCFVLGIYGPGYGLL